MNSPVLLQMCPFSNYLESGLAARGEILRWYELDEPARTAWLAAQASRVQVVVTAGHVGCATELLSALPSLRIVAINGVGVDRVDLAWARAHGVRVSTTPGTLSEDVADLAVGLTIALLRRIPTADAYVRQGDWERHGEFPLARKVTGRRFGIVGLGNIGAAIAARLAAFGPIAYAGPRRKPVPYRYEPDVLTLARESDVLLIACPANAATAGLIDAAVLDALGPKGWLINVSRGAIVHEEALALALASGRIAGAGLDVFADEPRVPLALRESPSVVLTPHMASGTHETREAMADLVLANIDAVLGGREPPTAVA